MNWTVYVNLLGYLENWLTYNASRSRTGLLATLWSVGKNQNKVYSLLVLTKMRIWPRFRPETLACRLNQDPETCLTISQIGTVHKLHSDYYETNQTFIFNGFLPGSENGLFDTVVGPSPNVLALQYYRDWVLKLSVLPCFLEYEC